MKRPVSDRHGEWDRCHRCGYPGQITRAVAYGGFLKYDPIDGLLCCWNGRDCTLRLKRKRRQNLAEGKNSMLEPDGHDLDVGDGVVIRWDTDGRGFIWKHPGCRAWSTLRFVPDPASTGHRLVRGGKDAVASLTIAGSLLCPGGCGTHGVIEDGRWRSV